MDQEIEAKIEELMSLCQKKNANVVVSVVEENNENTTRIFADTEGLQTCIRAIEVAALKYINAKMKRMAKKRPHIHIVDMMGEDADITSVLERIFGGGKRDDN